MSKSTKNVLYGAKGRSDFDLPDQNLLGNLTPFLHRVTSVLAFEAPFSSFLNLRRPHFANSALWLILAMSVMIHVKLL